MLKLHGVPLSQPYRAVAWALLQKRVPFETALVVPGSPKKMGSRHEDFLAKAPLGKVPVIEDNGVVVQEAAAILGYLGETRDWSADLYPSDAAARARVNSFMHWHHQGTRQLVPSAGWGKLALLA